MGRGVFFSCTVDVSGESMRRVRFCRPKGGICSQRESLAFWQQHLISSDSLL